MWLEHSCDDTHLCPFRNKSLGFKVRCGCACATYVSQRSQRCCIFYCICNRKLHVWIIYEISQKTHKVILLSNEVVGFHLNELEDVAEHGNRWCPSRTKARWKLALSRLFLCFLGWKLKVGILSCMKKELTHLNACYANWEFESLNEVLTMPTSVDDSQFLKSSTSSPNLFETCNVESNIYTDDDFRSGTYDDHLSSLDDLIASSSYSLQNPHLHLVRLCTIDAL